MDVGMMMIFSSYGWEKGSDALMWEEELRLAEIAADSGFDCLWSAEHHFNDYSFVPDNLQLMTTLRPNTRTLTWARRRSSCPGTTPCGWRRTPPSWTCSAAGG